MRESSSDIFLGLTNFLQFKFKFRRRLVLKFLIFNNRILPFNTFKKVNEEC